MVNVKMKSKGIYLVLLSLFISASILVSCGGKPADVISEDKMVDLLVDMQLTEAYVNTQSSSSNKERVEYGRRVLEAHGVTEEQLDTTLAWYGRNMDDYTQLFDKVDKEILKRKKKYTEVAGAIEESDNLWPFSPHILISELSGNHDFTFSLQNPAIEKGKIVELSFYLPNVRGLRGTLGVEYTDGYGEAAINNFSSKNSVKIALQTDTAKEVARLYGVLNFKDNPVFPILIDSLIIRTEPLDTLSYRSKKRNQKNYGVMTFRPKPVAEPEVKDSLPNDSIAQVDTILPSPAEKPVKPVSPTETPKKIKRSETPIKLEKAPK